jgi:hypothetical protein
MQEQTFYLCRYSIPLTVNSTLGLSCKVPTNGAAVGTAWAKHSTYYSFAFRNRALCQSGSPRPNAMNSIRAHQAALTCMAGCASIYPRSKEGIHNPIAGGPALNNGFLESQRQSSHKTAPFCVGIPLSRCVAGCMTTVFSSRENVTYLLVKR